MNSIIEEIRRELRDNASEQIKQSSRRFFKEEVQVYGHKTAFVSSLAKREFKQLRGTPKADIFALCEELWDSGWLEESFIACQWSHALRGDYQPADFTVFERWLDRYVSNWASCDTFCNHTVGAFLEMYPDFLPELKRWARSENRWVRRGAAVSLIVPAKRGLFFDTICAVADQLLTDPDDMVQKGYGWMLKAASQAHEPEVFRYVMANKEAMPRTALRYAIEKMPKELKAQAMKK